MCDVPCVGFVKGNTCMENLGVAEKADLSDWGGSLVLSEGHWAGIGKSKAAGTRWPGCHVRNPIFPIYYLCYPQLFGRTLSEEESVSVAWADKGIDFRFVALNQLLFPCLEGCQTPCCHRTFRKSSPKIEHLTRDLSEGQKNKGPRLKGLSRVRKKGQFDCDVDWEKLAGAGPRAWGHSRVGVLFLEHLETTERFPVREWNVIWFVFLEFTKVARKGLLEMRKRGLCGRALGAGQVILTQLGGQQEVLPVQRSAELWWPWL